MHHCLVSKPVSKEAVIPTLPSLPCPASIPVSFQLWIKGNAKGVSKQSENPSVPQRDCSQLLVCPAVPAWGGSGCSDVSWSICISGSGSRSTPGVGEMILMFSVSCFQKSPFLHVWKTTQSSTSECLMLRATINAINEVSILCFTPQTHVGQGKILIWWEPLNAELSNMKHLEKYRKEKKVTPQENTPRSWDP